MKSTILQQVSQPTFRYVSAICSALLIASAPACQSPTETLTASCLPGASVACVCETGQHGAQICLADGRSLGTCNCTPTSDTLSADSSEDVPTPPDTSGSQETDASPVPCETHSDCEDGLDCTANVCDPKNGCRTELHQGYCLIEATCWPTGASHPAQPCTRCNPDYSVTAWTQLPPANCSALPDCQPECRNGGVCVEDNSCNCQGTGFEGPQCAQPVCSPPCSNGGLCVAPDSCSCDETGYSGPRCSEPACTPQCQNGGTCTAPNVCDCGGTGFTGPDCDAPLPCADLGVACPSGFECTTDGTCIKTATQQAWVPPGEFWMGCNSALDSECQATELPQHHVSLSRGYAVRIYEVTAEEYRACVLAGVCTPSVDPNRPPPGNPSGTYRTYGIPGKERHPINYVTWGQASAYCNWSGKAQGTERLCTEAEWERAARGGCENLSGDCRTNMRTYVWGEQSPDCSLTNTYSAGAFCEPVTYTSEVGGYSKDLSPYGIFDMAGNVAEYVQDEYVPYAEGFVIDPIGSSSSSESSIVLRHGSFYITPANTVRASGRTWGDPNGGMGYWLGIRCCQTLP